MKHICPLCHMRKSRRLYRRHVRTCGGVKARR